MGLVTVISLTSVGYRQEEEEEEEEDCLSLFICLKAYQLPMSYLTLKFDYFVNVWS